MIYVAMFAAFCVFDTDEFLVILFVTYLLNGFA